MSAGHVEVFIRGSDNYLHHKWKYGKKWDDRWGDLGMKISDSPSSTSRVHDNRDKMNVVVKSSDNHLWERQYSNNHLLHKFWIKEQTKLIS